MENQERKMTVFFSDAKRMLRQVELMKEQGYSVNGWFDVHEYRDMDMNITRYATIELEREGVKSSLNIAL